LLSGLTRASHGKHTSLLSLPIGQCDTTDDVVQITDVQPLSILVHSNFLRKLQPHGHRHVDAIQVSSATTPSNCVNLIVVQSPDHVIMCVRYVQDTRSSIKSKTCRTIKQCRSEAPIAKAALAHSRVELEITTTCQHPTSSGLKIHFDYFGRVADKEYTRMLHACRAHATW
jgi:hypothetical protein